MTIASNLLHQHIQTFVEDNKQWQTLIADDLLWATLCAFPRPSGAIDGTAGGGESCNLVP